MEFQKNAFEAAKKWLLESGIQNLDEKSAGFYGSFADWLDLKDGKVHAAYPEITGYGISAMVFLDLCQRRAKLSDANGFANKDLQKRAMLAANWLFEYASTKTSRGIGILDKLPYEIKNSQKISYSFDTGMCLNGLTSFMEAGYKTHAKGIEEIANYLAGKVDSKGALNPYEPKSLNFPSKWSMQEGSYHSKVAIGIHHAGKLLGREDLVEISKRMANFSITKQEKDGRFITDETDKSTYTHAHCYSIEGLLYFYQKLGDGKYLDAAILGARHLQMAQFESGGISRKFKDGKFIQDEGSDILSQAIRIWRLCESFAKTGEFEKNAARGVERLTTHFQISELNPKNLQTAKNARKINGGFMYGYDDGKLVENVNCWAAMFALQALWLTDSKNANEFDMALLI
ncbi:MAG: hypothetical protein AABY04_01205 [Candidatus Micrarchaeota archaeon]